MSSSTSSRCVKSFGGSVNSFHDQTNTLKGFPCRVPWLAHEPLGGHQVRILQPAGHRAMWRTTSRSSNARKDSVATPGKVGNVGHTTTGSVTDR